MNNGAPQSKSLGGKKRKKKAHINLQTILERRWGQIQKCSGCVYLFLQVVIFKCQFLLRSLSNLGAQLLSMSANTKLGGFVLFLFFIFFSQHSLMPVHIQCYLQGLVSVAVREREEHSLQ